VIRPGGRSNWDQPDTRRRAFHALHLVARYARSCRAPQVWRLTKDYSPAIAE
jgi:hypothetical protein